MKIKKFFKKLGSIFDFYKEMEENHQIYFINSWRKNSKEETMLTLKGLSSNTVYEDTPMNIYQNKSIFDALSKDDKEKIQLFLEGYGVQRIESVELYDSKKKYQLKTIDNCTVEYSEYELLENVEKIDKKSIKLILKERLKKISISK